MLASAATKGHQPANLLAVGLGFHRGLHGVGLAWVAWLSAGNCVHWGGFPICAVRRRAKREDCRDEAERDGEAAFHR